MSAITRGRTIAAAGFLAASTLLGTALAVGPAMEHEAHNGMQNQGHSAMQQDGKPGMQQEGTLAMQQEGKPAPQHEATLTASRKVRPAPWDEASPNGMPVE